MVNNSNSWQFWFHITEVNVGFRFFFKVILMLLFSDGLFFWCCAMVTKTQTHIQTNTNTYTQWHRPTDIRMSYCACLRRKCRLQNFIEVISVLLLSDACVVGFVLCNWHTHAHSTQSHPHICPQPPPPHTGCNKHRMYATWSSPTMLLSPVWLKTMQVHFCFLDVST